MNVDENGNAEKNNRKFDVTDVTATGSTGGRDGNNGNIKLMLPRRWPMSNNFWSTFHNPPTKRIAITTALQPVLSANLPTPCPTVRRLAMARRMAAGATDRTSRGQADRVIGDWWPGCSVDRFRSTAEAAIVSGKAATL